MNLFWKTKPECSNVEDIKKARTLLRESSKCLKTQVEEQARLMRVIRTPPTLSLVKN